MKILIPSHLHDTQAIFVQLALERIGHEVNLFFPADLPSKQCVSSYIDDSNERWKLTNHLDVDYLEPYDVVWWCDERKPYIPVSKIHCEDYPFVVKENQSFYQAITQNISPQAWWVNEQEASSRSRCKLSQLRIAKKLGLNIPATLCSNDPKDIRCFLFKHEKQGVLYKPLNNAHSWIEDGSSFKTAAPMRISMDELPSNSFLQLLPALFQQEIRKKFELKVMCFGDYLVGGKIYSSTTSEKPLNLEGLIDKNIQLEFHNIPPELAKKIRQIMLEFGLVFACLNFIVDAEGNYIFLSLDERPEFLWMEECNPNFRMLDAFVQFLLKKTRKFRWNPNRFEHCIDRYKRLIIDKLLEKKERHLDLRAAIVTKK